MRTVALEEHFLLISEIKSRFDINALNMVWLNPNTAAELSDLGDGRLAAMDESGITVQVLSASMPGADLLDGKEGIDFARLNNTRLAEAVQRHPNRFAGFAHLPMRSPSAAVDELERAVRDLGFRGAMVNALTAGRFLDHESFAPLLERFAELDVPLYLHPNIPPKQVFDAYYSGLPDIVGGALASGAFGWHAETGLHILRLALSGTLARHPGLKVIVGHMGEMLPFMLARADLSLGCQELGPVGDLIVDRVYITTSGFFTLPPFQAALSTFGVDRILFSVDYPYVSNKLGRAFLDALPLAEIDKAKIAHGNADRLLKLTPSPSIGRSFEYQSSRSTSRESAVQHD
jgi:uncharacterized protein